MIRVAATADIHVGADTSGLLRAQLQGVRERADVLLVAGDLTRRGTVEEALAVADALVDIGVPVLAVLGNHDFHADHVDEVVGAVEKAGVRVLQGESEVLDLPGGRLGVAGVKGFGTGFPGATAADFGEPLMRAFVAHARDEAGRLRRLLEDLDGRVDHRVALMHYAPVPDTLVGERAEIWAFLGSHLLGEAVDRGGAALALHGHAHAGTEKGTTPGGVPVRNVAQPVIGRPYEVYVLGAADGRV